MTASRHKVTTGSKPPQRFTVSPAWVVTESGSSLVVSGGADALYEVARPDGSPSTIAALAPGSSFVRADLDAGDEAVVDQLITAGVVVPVLETGSPTIVAWAGDTLANAPDAGPGWRSAREGEHTDLVVIVRTSTPLLAILDRLDYANLTTPHLLIDAGFHHVVSVGPLVFPGETACLACLHGRVTERWPDAPTPGTPAASLNPLAPALAATEIERVASGDTSLAGHTSAWNLASRSVSTELLLRVGLCAMCGETRMDQAGRGLGGS